MRANIMSDVHCEQRGPDGRKLRSLLLGGSATLSVTDERRSGAAMMGIRFPLRSGVDTRNINSASPGDHFSSTGNMALPVAGEIDALAALHCNRGNAVHLSSSGCPPAPPSARSHMPAAHGGPCCMIGISGRPHVNRTRRLNRRGEVRTCLSVTWFRFVTQLAQI